MSRSDRYKAAIARGRRAQLRATSASYDTATKRIAIELSNGTLFAFPPSLVQGLHAASPEALADIEIYGAGTALHWEQLDVDFELSALLAGVFGTRAWMRELGRKGGSVSSPGQGARRARQRPQGRSASIRITRSEQPAPRLAHSAMFRPRPPRYLHTWTPN